MFSSFFFLTQGKNKKSRISPAALPRCQGNMPKVCFLFGEKKYYSSHMSFTYHISYEASVSVLFSAFCKRSVNTPAFGFFSFFSLRLTVSFCWLNDNVVPAWRSCRCRWGKHRHRLGRHDGDTHYWTISGTSGFILKKKQETSGENPHCWCKKGSTIKCRYSF